MGGPKAKSRSQNSKPIAPGGEFERIGTRHRRNRRSHDSEGSRELEAGWRHRQQVRPGYAASPRRSTPDGATSCLGFIKRLGDATRANIRLVAAKATALPARRAAVGCMLNRLILLTAGNEPKLAELFARAELRRGNCAAAASPATSADWVTGAQKSHSCAARSDRAAVRQDAGFHATFCVAPALL